MVRRSKSRSEPEAGTSHSYRPINIREVEEYAQQLEEIFDKFKSEIKNDNGEALAHTISALKEYTAKLVPSMGEVDTEAVLQCFSEPNCVTLRESLGPKWVQKMNPEEDTPSGEEVLRQIPKEKTKPAIQAHCVTLFNNISTVTGYMSAVCVNLSLLIKITDEATFRVILAVSVKPLVQLNIPPGILNPLEEKKVETGREKEMTQLKKALLPCHDTQTLHWEVDNSPTWLLLAVLHLKLNLHFFSKGMQVDIQNKFRVHPKQLSKLLSSHKYYGGTDRKAVKWAATEEQESQPKKKR